MSKNETKAEGAVASPETAAAVEAGAADVELGSKHPGVAGFAAPRSSRSAGGATDTDPVPIIIETATPGIARAVADLDAERIDPDGAERQRNVKERALAGHRAPDTVDTPEYKTRLEDNAAALQGTGGVPRD